MPRSQSLKQTVESPPQADITLLLFPRALPLPPSQRIKEGHLHHQMTMYHTKGPNDIEPLAAILCKPSRPYMSLPQAPSFRRCPTPHRSLSCNTSHREMLQAAE
jgi:hypothetical protein